MSEVHKKFEQQEHPNSHGTIYPAEVRVGEPISCKLKFKIGEKDYFIYPRVWKISPVGIDLLSDEVQLTKGFPVDLELSVGSSQTYHQGLVVDDITYENNKRFIFIRFLIDNKSPQKLDSERRKSQRWMCSGEFYPTAVAHNPAKFNDFVFFKVVDASNGGFKLSTSLRNKYLVPGMILDCIFNFPMISQYKIKVTIKSIRILSQDGKDSLILGVEYKNDDKVLKEIIGQYLFQFGTIDSMKSLVDSGIKIKHISSAITYSYVKTKEEYEGVLKLRFKAYSKANKIREGATLSDMGDEFDARSRIVIGKYHNQVVCSSRLIFNEYDDRMEQEKYVTWPDTLPRRDEIVESMRTCTDPDFRGGDLLFGMFHYIAITVAQSGRRWLMICATKEMLPLYLKIGFKMTELSYPHKELGNQIHYVIIADFPSAIRGYGVNPFVWNVVWSDTLKYLNNYDTLPSDPIAETRVAIYKLFAPFVRLAMKLKKIKPINNTWKELK